MEFELAEVTSHTVSFDIIPVIHLREGKTVDFTGHNADESAIFDDWQPLETAKFWIGEGASWIHVVDIDAMFQRDSSLNWTLIKQICELPVRVQLVGGHFQTSDIENAFQAGVTRIMLDATQPDINLLTSAAVAAYGSESIGVLFATKAVGKIGAIDEHEDWPANWAAAGGEEVVSRALQLYHLGINTGIHTTIADDGAMSGCDVRITQELASLSGINFQVGGEIYDMDDVVTCYNRKGVTGVLIGRALYNGNLNLKQALRTTKRTIAFETALPTWRQEQDTVKAHLRYKIALGNLKKHLSENTIKVLDAGGGNGQDSLALAALGHKIELVDESTAMIADFKDSNEMNPVANNINTHQFNIRAIPGKFSDEQFDLVLCHNVIQYVTDWQDLLSSAIKPLKSGGLFSLITRNRQALPYLVDLDRVEPTELNELLKSGTAHSPIIDSDITLYTPGELINWLAEAGFSSIQQYGILALNHYAATTPSAENESLISKLELFENMIGDVSPYRDIARYIQLIAVKR